MYNELPAGAAFATIHFLLTKESCNITLKYKIFYKLIINFIIAVCIHYSILVCCVATVSPVLQNVVWQYIVLL